MTPEEESAYTIKLGRDIESDEFAVVTYILLRAKRDAIIAREMLVDVLATDTAEIIRLQGEVMRQRDLTRWLREALEAASVEYAGQTVEEQFEIREALGISNDM